MAPKKTKKTTKTPKKPSKTNREKNNVKNQRIQNARKEKAKHHAEKQKLFRNKLSKTTTSEQKERQKEQNKIAKQRHKARLNHSISITEKTSDYGDYLWIDSVPLCDMTQLLTNFKTEEFRKTFENNNAYVQACNDSQNDNEKSTYWMLDQKRGKTMGIGGNWKDHPHTSSTINIVLSNFMMKVGLGLNNYFKENCNTHIDFITMTPGFVQTTSPTHQHLHLDTKDVNFNKAGHSFILHVPLEVEGMHLRLGKFNEKSQLNHGLIHIPFGSGILLHLTQLHAGHYGNPNNFRFHAVLSDHAWNGSHLLPLKEYLKKTTTLKEGDRTGIVAKFENDLKETTAVDEMKTDRDEVLYKTTYYNHLLKFNPSLDFLCLVETADNDKKKASTK